MHQISANSCCIRRGPSPRSFVLAAYGRPNFQNEGSGTLPKTSEFGTLPGGISCNKNIPALNRATKNDLNNKMDAGGEGIGC